MANKLVKCRRTGILFCPGCGEDCPLGAEHPCHDCELDDRFVQNMDIACDRPVGENNT